MIGAVIVWVIAMIKAFSGVRWDIPYIGPIARSQVDGTHGLGRDSACSVRGR